MLDSLVRVSRRVVWNHFANILSAGVTNRPGSLDFYIVSMLSTEKVQEAIGYPNNAAVLSPVQGMTGGYNTQAEAQATFLRLFTPNQTDVGLPTGKCTTRTPFGTCG
jgi:hypothetical protein